MEDANINNNERQFKGVWIDKEIWLDKRLNALDKVILTEIDSLDNEDGCTASNKYLSEFCQCSETKISNAISKLIELDYLELKSFDGRIRILKSRLTKSVRQTYKICKADSQKVYANNIENNIENINNNIYSQIIDYLNEKAGTHYRSNTNSTQRHIKTRLNEKYTIDDFIKVIDNKVKEWKGTKYEQYLRPDTLFSSKFESYLNGKINSSTNRNKKFAEREYSKEKLNSLYVDIRDIEI